MNIAYNVDCMEYMATLPDKAFDLAVVDPPYGDGNSRSDHGEKEHWNRVGGLFDRYKKVTRTGGDMGGKIRKKNNSLGRIPRAGILQRIVPCFT